MDPLSQINSLSSLAGGMPGLSSLFPGGMAAQRTAGIPGMPPSSMEGLMGMMQMQEKMTAMMLRLLLELFQGRGAGSGGSGGGSSGGAAGASGAGGAGSDEPVSGDVKKWVTGDTQGLDGGILNALAQVGQKLGKKITVASGFRSRQEQEVLYQKYLNGTGNLAAKPGTSRHESGNAADVNVDGTPLASYPGGRAAASAAGLHFPVPGEPWHAELT